MSIEKMIPRGTLFEFWAELKKAKLLPAARKVRKVALKEIEATDGFVLNGKRDDGREFSGYLNPVKDASGEDNMAFIAEPIVVGFEKASRDLIWSLYETHLSEELTEQDEDRLAYLADVLGKSGALQDALSELENEPDGDIDDDNIKPITEA